MVEGRSPIRCYVSPAGNNKIRDWYLGLLVRERSDADEFIATMQKISCESWQMPEYRRQLKPSKGVSKKEIKGLGELRWESEKKQHRLLGFFGNGVWYAVMGCVHKQQVYDPADAIAIAVKRMKQIERQEVGTVEYDI
jgi:hypothetical protein